MVFLSFIFANAILLDQYDLISTPFHGILIWITEPIYGTFLMTRISKIGNPGTKRKGLHD